VRLTAHPSSDCSGSECDVDTDWDLDADAMSGIHTITVQAEDAAGHVRTLSWTVDLSGEPTDIDLEPVFEARSSAPAAKRTGRGAGCGFVASRFGRQGVTGAVREITTGRWRTKQASGPETTERYAEGGYRVTRCTDAGELLISQNVGPVPVPGGYALLEIGRTMKEGDSYGTSRATYANPNDPAFIRAWKRAGDRARALVLPPTDR
jgi:hypothetical protein